MEVFRIQSATNLTECYTVITSKSTTRSEAVLNYTFTKSDMGIKLVCLVEHVAYPTGSENSSVALDVLCEYSFIRLVMFSASDEGWDSLTLFLQTSRARR